MSAIFELRAIIWPKGTSRDHIPFWEGGVSVSEHTSRLRSRVSLSFASHVIQLIIDY